jgi:hypothetical protein
MIKLSEKGRKILRAVYRGVGTAAVSLAFGACNWLMMPVMYGPPPNGGAYGMPPEYGMPPYEREDIYLRGIVKSKKTGEAIQEISVKIIGVTNFYTITTWNDGSFDIIMPIMDNYTIIFTDTDGDENGSYKQQTINLTKEEIKALPESTLIVELEETGDENEDDESSETDEG